MAVVQHATRPLLTPEFTRRAACAWIRAADAGLIDAAELAWLLSHLPGHQAGTGVQAKEC